jgi:hypothetical protein
MHLWLSACSTFLGLVIFKAHGEGAFIQFCSLLLQWYLGIRPFWNKSNLVYAYVLFGRENFCVVYDLCLEYDSRARTFMSQNESWHR